MAMLPVATATDTKTFKNVICFISWCSHMLSLFSSAVRFVMS